MCYPCPNPCLSSREPAISLPFAAAVLRHSVAPDGDHRGSDRRRHPGRRSGYGAGRDPAQPRVPRGGGGCCRRPIRLPDVTRHQAAAAIAAGDLSQRLAIDGDDEIAELAEQFNEMALRLDANAAELRRLAAADERSRLAGELHDSVNQQIFSISMLAATARKKMGSHPVSDDLARLETLARETHTEMRALVRELRPTALEHADLSTALKRYVSDFGSRYGLTVVVDAPPIGRLPADLETALYRIAQEALGNAVRHASAKQVHLSLRRDDGVIELSVQDDGHGFDVQAHREGLGLHSMRERAQAFGGTCEVRSEPGKGSSIYVRVRVT